MEKNDYIIYILSHNSKNYTQRVFNQLKKQTDNLYVLENSSIPEETFDNEFTINLGVKNIGVGGMYDWIIDKHKNDKNLFIGIFNNDIFNISDNFIECLLPHLNAKTGIIHSSIIDEGCPYPVMFKQNNNFREVFFIENICPVFNVEILKVLHSSIPIHIYGWVDLICSNISNSLKLKNIIIDKTSITHERSGIRKKMNPIDFNFDIYKRNAALEFEKWVYKNPHLQMYTNKKHMNVNYEKN